MIYKDLWAMIIKTRGTILQNPTKYPESMGITNDLIKLINNGDFEGAKKYFIECPERLKIMIFMYFPKIIDIVNFDLKSVFKNWPHSSRDNKDTIVRLSKNSRLLTDDMMTEIGSIIKNKKVKLSDLKLGLQWRNSELNIHFIDFIDETGHLIKVKMNDIEFGSFFDNTASEAIMRILKRRGHHDSDIAKFLYRNAYKKSRYSSEKECTVRANSFRFMLKNLLSDTSQHRVNMTPIFSSLIKIAYDASSYSFADKNDNQLYNFISRKISKDVLKFKRTDSPTWVVDSYFIEYLNHRISLLNRDINKVKKAGLEYGVDMTNIEKPLGRSPWKCKYILEAASDQIVRTISLILIQNKSINSIRNFTIGDAYKWSADNFEKSISVFFIKEFAKQLVLKEQTFWGVFDELSVILKLLVKDHVIQAKKTKHRKGGMTPKALVIRHMINGAIYNINHKKILDDSKSKTRGYAEYVYENCGGIEHYWNEISGYGTSKIDAKRNTSEESIRRFFVDISEKKKLAILKGSYMFYDFMKIDWERALGTVKKLSEMPSGHFLDTLPMDIKKIANKKYSELKLKRGGKYVIRDPNESAWVFLAKNRFPVNLTTNDPIVKETYSLRDFEYEDFLEYCAWKNKTTPDIIDQVHKLSSITGTLGTLSIAYELFEFYAEHPKSFESWVPQAFLPKLIKFVFINEVQWDKLSSPHGDSKHTAMGKLCFIYRKIKEKKMTSDEIKMELNILNKKMNFPKASKYWIETQKTLIAKWSSEVTRRYWKNDSSLYKIASPNEIASAGLEFYIKRKSIAKFPCTLLIHLLVSYKLQCATQEEVLCIMIFIDEHYEDVSFKIK